MKITKYPQSCLLIEHKGKRILIDPGSFVAEKYSAADLGPVDVVLLTHEHADHVNPNLIKEVIGDSSAEIIANQSTSSLLDGFNVHIVKDGEAFTAAGIKISAHELPHVPMIDGSAGPQNTGYLIDGNFFHPGDGVKISNVQAQSAGIPIAGPDLSYRDAFDFIKQLGCKTAIPIHYDYFLGDPAQFAQLGSSILPETKIIVLDNGQSAEI